MLEKLIKLLNVREGPMTEGDWFVLRCSVDFEPNGRASETWEEYWTIELPYTPYYWEGTKGWNKGSEKAVTSFKASTLDNVIKKAIYYLENYPEHK